MQSMYNNVTNNTYTRLTRSPALIGLTSHPFLFPPTQWREKNKDKTGGTEKGKHNNNIYI